MHGVAPTVLNPTTGASVDLAEHRLVASLIRLAELGADGFELRFDDPRIVARAASLLSADAETVWDPAALVPIAQRGLETLTSAAESDPRLADLLLIWRPRALIIAGRAGELTGEQTLRLRLEDRLDGLRAQIEEATAAGDDDRAQALHARYIELGTTYASKLARAV